MNLSSNNQQTPLKSRKLSEKREQLPISKFNNQTVHNGSLGQWKSNGWKLTIPEHFYIQRFVNFLEGKTIIDVYKTRGIQSKIYLGMIITLSYIFFSVTKCPVLAIFLYRYHYTIVANTFGQTVLLNFRTSYLPWLVRMSEKWSNHKFWFKGAMTNAKSMPSGLKVQSIRSKKVL